MMKFRSLTNVRPTKDLGCQIICAPTEGQFKVTPEAAKVLIGPAEIALTRMPSLPMSSAKYLTLDSSALLATPITL